MNSFKFSRRQHKEPNVWICIHFNHQDLAILFNNKTWTLVSLSSKSSDRSISHYDHLNHNQLRPTRQEERSKVWSQQSESINKQWPSIGLSLSLSKFSIILIYSSSLPVWRWFYLKFSHPYPLFWQPIQLTRSNMKYNLDRIHIQAGRALSHGVYRGSKCVFARFTLH